MLYAYTTSDQTVAPGTSAIFETNSVRTCLVEHVPGTSTITIDTPGIYEISVSADATSATTGLLTLQLFNNDVAVPGIWASNTIETSNNIRNYDFGGLIRIRQSCPAISNTANLTVRNIGENDAVISNISIVVKKV